MCIRDSAIDAGAVHLRHQRLDVSIGGVVPQRLRGGGDLGRDLRLGGLQPDLLAPDAPAAEFAAIMNGPRQQHSGIRNEF